MKVKKDVRTNIRMPEKLVKEAKKAAKRHKVTFSEFVRDSIKRAVL